jgi:hypothetical protein
VGSQCSDCGLCSREHEIEMVFFPLRFGLRLRLLILLLEQLQALRTAGSFDSSLLL